MQEKANIVVIGGGVVGCSVLYHLARNGAHDCILLERDILTSGSSWHAAGGFHTINSDPHMAKLQEYTIELYSELEEESGQNCGRHASGGIILTGREERLDFLKYTHARAQSMGIETALISIEEAKELVPLMDETKFCGALWEKHSGHLDPSGTTHAYAKAARKRGAKIYEKTQVQALKPNADGTWTIETTQGSIHAEKVVNAGGLWAREVGRMIGVELPLLAMEHHYLITENLPSLEERKKNKQAEISHAIDLEGEIYMRQEGSGVLLGTYEQASVPWSVEETPWDFSMKLLEHDLDRISPSLSIGFSHFPELENVGIKRFINGPFVFTPDGNPLIGPLRGFRNFWLACGVMAGFSQGGGVGWAVANWMTEGDPGIDTLAIDVARFGNWTNPDYTNAKVQENYQRRFRIVLPNETLSAGRPHLTSPIYSKLKNYGALFDSTYGLEHALWFAGENKTPQESPSFRRSEAFAHVGEEALVVRKAAGLLEITNFSRYHISGTDASKWLEKILAGKMPNLNRLSLCPMLDDKARILGDFTVGKIAENNFILFGSGSAEDFHLRYFEETLQKEQQEVNITPLTASISGLAIAGPEALEILKTVVKDPASLEEMKFLDFTTNHLINDARIYVGRISFTGEKGFELWCENEHLPTLFDALMTAGKPKGLRPFGARALNSLRLEKSFGAWGREYTTRDHVIEAGLGRFVDRNRDTFIGTQALKNFPGPEKQLLTLTFEHPNADAHGDEPIFLGNPSNKVVTRTTSGGYSYSRQLSVAMAYIPCELIESKELYVDILGDRVPIKIATEPLVDPSGLVMRS